MYAAGQRPYENWTQVWMIHKHCLVHEQTSAYINSTVIPMNSLSKLKEVNFRFFQSISALLMYSFHKFIYWEREGGPIIHVRCPLLTNE